MMMTYEEYQAWAKAQKAKNGTRMELEEMPFDKVFLTDDGPESCHATGEAVFYYEQWWNEYVDSHGGFHYGR